MKHLFTLLLVFFHGLLSAQEKKHTVLFDLGSYTISVPCKTQLDSLIYNEVLHPGVKLSLVGYADYIGDSSSNMELSQKRAEAVKAYLVSMGFKETDLEAVQWKGEIAAKDTNTKDGIPKDRRVDIVLKEPKKPVSKQSFVSDISKYKINSVIRLNILFPEMKHHYLAESLPVLESFYQFMLQNPTLKVSIEGHICCGTNPRDEGYDLETQTVKLSYNRAKEVYDYMIKKGIPAIRMSYKGLGFSQPLYPQEETKKQRDENKRVEIRIMEK